MRTPDLVIDHTDGERNQRELIRATFAIDAANGATAQVLGVVKRFALDLVCRVDQAAQILSAFGGCYDHIIVAADVAHKIIGIAIIAHHALADTPEQANQIIASQKAVNIVKGFEIVKIQVENTPGIGASNFAFNRQLCLVAAGQTNQR